MDRQALVNPKLQEIINTKATYGKTYMLVNPLKKKLPELHKKGGSLNKTKSKTKSRRSKKKYSRKSRKSRK